MIEKNGRKFVSLAELAEHLNRLVPAAETYRIPELTQAWANAKEKFYARTGEQITEGEFYLFGDSGETLLAESGCALIEFLASVDGHTVPVLQDGVKKMFNP